MKYATFGERNKFYINTYKHSIKTSTNINQKLVWMLIYRE